MAVVTRDPAGWVLPWATNSSGEHPVVLCDHWIDTPQGPMGDCPSRATWRSDDETAEDQHACDEHADWLRHQQVQES